MFGLFKKKKKASSVAIEAAVGLIDFQLTTTNTSNNNKKLFNEYSRGYIFGLCDSLLQTLKIDEIESMAALTVIHINLFGEEKGTAIIKQSFNEQKNKNFKNGQIRGGEDFIKSIKSNNPPMGLADYLTDNNSNEPKPATKVIVCSKCSQKLRVPTGKDLLVKCNNCSDEFHVNT